MRTISRPARKLRAAGSWTSPRRRSATTSGTTPFARTGAVIVETALVIPVFALFLVAILEFGHAYLVIGTLNAAAKRAARYGSCDDVTTAQVRSHINQTLSKTFKPERATILIKDGNIFDTADLEPKEIDYSGLNDIELSSAKTRQLFIIRIGVPYEDVALIPPFWVKGMTLWGQSVSRHE